MARQKGQAEVERKASALETLTIEYVAPDDLTPNDYNPNRQNEHEFSLLQRSIREDGFTQPVIVGKDGRIVDGEHRWRAARELGLQRIPIVRVPMEAAQARIATLRHNRARGSEDVELSVAVLRDLDQLGALEWAAESLEIADDELNRLLEDIAAPEALASAEFGEAWVPAKDDTPGTERDSVSYDATATAADTVREREARIIAAKNEEERQAIRAEQSVYRVALTFTAEEAEDVRPVLGTNPAEKVLELCRRERQQATAAA